MLDEFNINQKTLKYILENLYDFVAVIDIEGKIIFITRSAEKILGYSYKDLIGRNIFNFVYQDDIKRVNNEYEELLKNPGLVQFTRLKVLTKGNSIKFLEGTRKNLLDNPDIEGILLTVKDVTETIENEAKLKKTKDLLDITEKLANIGGWEWDVVNKKMFWTSETYRIHGFDEAKFTPGSDEHIKASLNCYYEEDRKIIAEAFNKCINEGVEYEIDCRFISLVGQKLWIKTIGKPFYEDGKIVKIIGTISDITKKKREQLIVESRISLVNYSYKFSLDEFLQKFLDEAERLTESQIGFYHFVEKDQETLKLQMWSSNTIKNMCSAEGKDVHYKIKDAGVWAECVILGKPIIHNDYNNLPNKKGMPEGHAPVIRELVIPLYRDEKIVAILGVGNKITDYDENDIETLYKLSDFAWDIAGRKKIEEILKKNEEITQNKNLELEQINKELKKAREATLNIIEDLTFEIDEKKKTETALKLSEEKFRSLYENSFIGIYQTTPDGRILMANPALIKMMGFSSFEEIRSINIEIEFYAPSYSRAFFKETIENKGKIVGWESAWKKKDGTLLFVRESASVVYDKNNKPLYYQGSVEDITDKKLAEEQLRESEEKYRQLITQMEQGLAVHEAIFNESRKMIDYRFIDMNPSFEQQTGLRKENLIGKTVFEIMPETESYWIEQYETVIKTGKPLYYENYSKELNKYFEVVAYRNQENQFAVIVNDVTQKKISENALRESEEKYRVLFETMQNGFYRSSPEGYFMDANPAFIKMLGYNNKEDLLKVYIPEALYEHPSDRDQLTKVSRLNPKQIYKLKRKDGKIIWVEDNSRYIRNEKGEILYHEGITEDVTERILTETALHESEERLRLSLYASNQGLYDLDLKTGNAVTNDQYAIMLGYDPRGFQENNNFWLGRLHPDDIERVKGIFNSYIQGIIPEYRVEFRQKTKDNKWIWILSIGKIIEYDELTREPLRMLGTHTDITGQKKAEEEHEKLQQQFFQSQKMESVGRLAGGIAHDFNNLLSVIIGHCELAMLKINSGDKLYEHIDNIQKSAERSADLTRQLLAFARKQTISPKKLDINETVEGMLKIIRRLIGENIELLWIPKNGIGKVNMDPTQLDQLLANLCVNSRDAITGSGKIVIETSNVILDEQYCDWHQGVIPGEYIKLSVSDNGCGMDKETQEKIFEPFFTTKETGKGSGLGLATVYGIVKQNNGHINLYSEQGKGTTFQILIPKLIESEGINQSFVNEIKLQTGTETVLLVEDDPTLLELGKTMLLNFGYNVLTASNPGDAIKIVKEMKCKINLLITDVIMPEMNGNELAIILKQNCPLLKKLFISGYTADVIAKHGVLDEGVQFIQKPFTMKDFAAKVRETLDS